MAFVLRRIGEFLIVRIDSKITKQPIGISEKPHTVLKIDALWLIWCSMILRSNSIPDKSLKETSVGLGFWDTLSLRLEKIKAKYFWPDSTFH